MKFKCVLVCFLISFSHVVHAETNVPSNYKAIRDVPYIADNEPAHRLDLYLPATPHLKPMPIVVWIHGGGWLEGSKDGFPDMSLLQDGYIGASVEYRFSTKAIFPAQIQDCQAAIRWLRANSKQYNIDPDHIGVWGASAGGHLVALLGTAGGKNAFEKIGGNEQQSDQVQAVMDWFGPSDFHTFIAQAAADKEAQNIFKFDLGSDPISGLLGVRLGTDAEKENAASPVHYISKDAPPFYIIHGTRDRLVPFAQSVELSNALEKVGVSVKLMPLEKADHGGAAFNRAPVISAIHQFFADNLKSKRVPTSQPR